MKTHVRLLACALRLPPSALRPLPSNLRPTLAWHATLALLLATTLSLRAATRVKADNADNLNLASSWTNNVVPGNLDAAQFDNVITGPLALSLGADTTWNQISFGNPGGDVSINAGNQLTLSNNTPIAFAAGTGSLTLNCDVTLAGAGFVTLPSAPSGRTITYGGIIQGRNVTVTLGSTGGMLRLGSTATTQIGSTVQVTASGMKVGIGASSIGNPLVSGPLGTNVFLWNSGINCELFAYNGGQTLGNPLRHQGGLLTFNSTNDLTFTGPIDLTSGGGSINVTNIGKLRLTGTITNGVSILKSGNGTLELGGTNTAIWNGGLSILGGIVRLLADNVIPDAGSSGTLRIPSIAQVLDMNGFNDTVNGVSGADGAGNCNGTIDNTAPGTTSVLKIGGIFTYTLAGILQNTGFNSKLVLVKTGSGGLILSNANNSFSGGITNQLGPLSINTPGSAGVGPIVTATSDPSVEFIYGGTGILTLTNNFIVESGAQPALYASSGSGTLDVAGVISGPGAVRRIDTGTGALIYSGDNTFTGGFTLVSRHVILRHPRALGRGTFSIGAVSTTPLNTILLLPGTNLAGANAITNAVIINRNFTIGGTNPVEFSGPVTLATTAPQPSINVTNLTGALISGPISGTGFGFNKTGAGLLTLSGVSTYDGPTSLSVGPMALGPGAALTGTSQISVGGGTLFDVSAVGTTYTIGATQILTGTGRIKGNMAVNGTLILPSIMSALTFSNNLTLGPGSTTTMIINRLVSQFEKLICFGTLTLGGTLVVNNVGNPLQLGDTFDLLGFTGSPGAFNTLTLPTLTNGLAWDTSNLAVNGTISVVSSAGAPQLSNPTLLNPSNFVMTASGGTSNGQFRVLSQTNLLTRLTNWVVLSTNTYDGTGTLTVTNPADPADPQRFFIIVQP